MLGYHSVPALRFSIHEAFLTDLLAYRGYLSVALMIAKVPEKPPTQAEVINMEVRMADLLFRCMMA